MCSSGVVIAPAFGPSTDDNAAITEDLISHSLGFPNPMDYNDEM
jgi:hypothetical protein